MTVFRITTLVLAVLQVLLASFTAMVGAFADGGDVWSRLLLIVVHPLCAVALLVLTLLPRIAPVIAYVVAALLLGSIIADLTFALLIATDAIKGDWFLPLMFSVVPVVGIAYAVVLAARSGQGSSRQAGA